MSQKEAFKIVDKRNLNADYPQMEFGTAINEVLKGRHIRRLEWEDEVARIALVDDKLMIFKSEDEMFHPLIISSGDIVGTDWVVAEEVQPTAAIPAHMMN